MKQTAKYAVAATSIRDAGRTASRGAIGLAPAIRKLFGRLRA